MRMTGHHVGRLILQARKSRNMSQVGLARRLNYGNTGQVVSNIERGLAGLPPKTIDRVSEVLKLEKETIITAMVRDYHDSLMGEVCKHTQTQP
jgi:transcriptional regulator with XRE-family HTH domain